MAYDSYKLIRIEKTGKVVTATVDNPPINLVTLALYGELAALSKEVDADDDALVFILKSANPDFFLAHFDVSAILSFPTDQPAARDAAPNEYHAMCERFRTMGKATIAQIEGRVGGGGSELAASFDMRFGVIGKTIINQMEVPLGILPGGTGTQRWPRLVGRGRAIEAILGGIDIDAKTAEHTGAISIARSRRTRSGLTWTRWRSASPHSRHQQCAWQRKRSMRARSRSPTAWQRNRSCSRK
jgi:enoyl-CoA hydratase/carnithine racemase